jgi:hypothetical protein
MKPIQERRDDVKRVITCAVTSAVAGLVTAAWLVATPAAAQSFDYLGPNKCINCHDHDDEKEWWEKEDGPPPNGHINALKQMENVDSPKYAGAVGLDASLDGVYDLEGSCVTCHATVFKGDANAGISCETCHGPGSGYLDSHQEEDSYQDSLTKGLLDVIGNLDAWSGDCIACHVMDDQRLIDAGHPSGDDFDLADKFGVVALHWGNEYQGQAVATAGDATRNEILARRRGAAAPTLTENAAVPAAPTPVAPTPAAPTPAAPTPAAPTPTAPTPAAPTPAAPTPAAPTPAAPTPAAPTPVAPTPAAPTPVAPTPAAPTPVAPTPAPPPPPSPPTPPPPPPPPRPKPETVVVIDQPPALPQSPAAVVATIQGRAIALLDRLLRREGRAPVRVTPPEPTTEYRGPDAELLRLQQEILALALDALGTAPQADNETEPAPEP